MAATSTVRSVFTARKRSFTLQSLLDIPSKAGAGSLGRTGTRPFLEQGVISYFLSFRESSGVRLLLLRISTSQLLASLELHGLGNLVTNGLKAEVSISCERMESRTNSFRR